MPETVTKAMLRPWPLMGLHGDTCKRPCAVVIVPRTGDVMVFFADGDSVHHVRGGKKR